MLNVRNVRTNRDIAEIVNSLEEIVNIFKNNIKIDGDRISFLVDGKEVAYIDRSTGTGKVFIKDTKREFVDAFDSSTFLLIQSDDKSPMVRIVKGDGSGDAFIQADDGVAYIGSKLNQVYINAAGVGWHIICDGTNVKIRSNKKLLVEPLKTASSHPTNYAPVYVNTDTGELYRV